MRCIWSAANSPEKCQSSSGSWLAQTVAPIADGEDIRLEFDQPLVDENQTPLPTFNQSDPSFVSDSIPAVEPSL